jgi:hypothetical protein
MSTDERARVEDARGLPNGVAAKDAVIVGIPLGTLGYTPGTGYRPRPCHRCMEAVWIGSTQLLAIKANGLKVWCVTCAFRCFGRRSVTVMNPQADSKWKEPGRDE